MKAHILITGANRGLGAALAEALAPTHQLTLLCRDAQAGEALARRLGSADLLIGDLGSLAGIRGAIQALAALPPLQGLIHNAAIWPHRLQMTADGLEQAFVVNHLAPFLINLELEARFQAEGTRVTQITAGLYPMGDRDFAATAVGANFSAFRTYASTKLLNLVTTMRFAQRWQGSRATINAVHPGVVRTDLGAMPGWKGLGLKLIKRLWLTPAEGAKAPLFVALDESTQGCFYNRFHVEALAPFMRDAAFGDAVWEQAMQWAREKDDRQTGARPANRR